MCIQIRLLREQTWGHSHEVCGGDVKCSSMLTVNTAGETDGYEAKRR